jgi:hypothetical protein
LEKHLDKCKITAYGSGCDFSFFFFIKEKCRAKIDKIGGRFS